MLQFTRHTLSDSLGWDCHTFLNTVRIEWSAVETPTSSPYCPYIIFLTRDYNKKKTFSLTLTLDTRRGEDFHVTRTGMFVGLKKRLWYMLCVFSLKGSTVGAFPVRFGYWAEYIFKPRPQYGILVFLRSSLPTSTPLFKWEFSHWRWMIGSLHDRKSAWKAVRTRAGCV